MEDWLEARRTGTLNSLVAPLTKEGTTSVLRPSHHKAPVKRKTAGQVSKTQIQAQIHEAATGITFKGADDEEADAGGKRKRKRPPQLMEALGPDGPRSSRRTRGDGRIFSPSEFAPINALGQLEASSKAPESRRNPPDPTPKFTLRFLSTVVSLFQLLPLTRAGCSVRSDAGRHAYAGQHTVGRGPGSVLGDNAARPNPAQQQGRSRPPVGASQPTTLSH